MVQAAWLIAPYVSMLVICRCGPLGRRVVGRTAVSLPIGWVAVVLLFAAVIGVWSPPLPAMVVLGVLSGFAMIVTGGGGGDDDPGAEPDDEPPPPSIDWEAFDAARRGWVRERPRPVMPRG